LTNFKRFILGIICGVLLACFVIGGLFLLFGRGATNNQSVLDSNLISLNNEKQGNGISDGGIDGNASLNLNDGESLDDLLSDSEDERNGKMGKNGTEDDSFELSNKTGNGTSGSNSKRNGNYDEDDSSYSGDDDSRSNDGASMVAEREAGDASWKEIIEKEAEQRDAKRKELEKLGAGKKANAEKEQVEKNRIAEEKRIQEEKQREEDKRLLQEKIKEETAQKEKAKLEEIERQKQLEEAKKKAEEKRIQEEAKKKAEIEAQKKAEEQRKKQEEEKRLAEEAKKKAEEKRIKEEARKKAEIEAQKKAEEQRKKQEEEKRLAEEAKKKAEEKRIQEEARKKAEIEAQKKAEEQRKKQEEEKKKAEEEQRKKDAENKKLAEKAEKERQMKEVERLVNTGKNALNSGNSDSALNLFEQADSKMPQDEKNFSSKKYAEMADSLHGKATSSKNVEQNKKLEKNAENYIVKSIADDDKVAKNHYLYSNIADEQKKEDIAIRELEKALSLDRDNYEYNYELGKKYYLKKEYKKAKECFERSTKIRPTSDVAFYNLGVTNRKLGLEKDAEKALTSAVGIRPTYTKAFIELARVAKVEKNLNASISYYSRAIASDASNIIALKEMAQVYAELGKNQSAEQYFLQAISKGDTDALTFYNLATVQIDLKKNE